MTRFIDDLLWLLTGYSTRLVYQPFVASLDELYMQADKVHGVFKDLIEAIASSTGGRALVAPLKGIARAQDKAQFKYKDRRNGRISWYRLTDLVRATIRYTTVNDMYKGLQHLMDTHHDMCIDILEFNDRFQRALPGGYRDLQMTIKVHGHVCELQLNTEAMLEVKETSGHRHFDVLRELVAKISEGGDLAACEGALQQRKWRNESLRYCSEIYDLRFRYVRH